MLAYLTNRANYFKREEDWFGVPLCDFASDIGFRDAHKVSEIRKSLVDLGLIGYKRGGGANASRYRVYWENIYKYLTSRYDIKKTPNEEPNDCFYCPWTENDDVNKDIERGIDNIIKNATYKISTDNQEFMDRLSNLKLDMMLKYNIKEEEARNMIITSFSRKAIENSVNENTFSVDTNDKVELGR